MSLARMAAEGAHGHRALHGYTDVHRHQIRKNHLPRSAATDAALRRLARFSARGWAEAPRHGPSRAQLGRATQAAMGSPPAVGDLPPALGQMGSLGGWKGTAGAEQSPPLPTGGGAAATGLHTGLAGGWGCSTARGLLSLPQRGCSSQLHR